MEPGAIALDEDPWAIARDQYLADLNENERRLFTGATVENLLVESTEIQESHEQRSQSRVFMRRLKPFLAAIEDYGSAIDVYSNIYPLALAPIWGTLRVILHLAKKFNRIFDRIVDVFERIGYVLPRFRDYERIFGKHQRIIKALSSAYLDIIILCSEIKVFIRSIQKSRMKSFSKLLSPLDHHLDEAVGRFRLHREDVEMEAEACQMIESAKHYDLELRDREVAAIERKAQSRKHLFHLLSPIDARGKQRKVLKLRHKGTGNWLAQKEEFNAWKSSQQSSVLCVYGIPGSGKTILSSCVIDGLQESMCERVVMVHHYCDYKDVRSLSPTTIAGAVITGLLESVEIPDDLCSLITYLYQDGQRSPDEDELTQILDSVLDLRLDHIIYVVLDGVDEVEEHDRKVLFGFIKHLMDCKHSVLKLMVTSRADISAMLCQPRTLIYREHISQNTISGDIDIFVRHTVRSLISSRDLMIRDISLEGEIVQQLADGAKGMFLWVTFQLGSLCDCNSDSDIRQALSNLPRDLEETYKRLLNKILNPQRKSLVRKMLQWIVCSRRLLHIDEILEAVAFTVDDDHWDPAKIPADPTRLIRASGNLIVVDDEDHTVQLAHYTVQQFLLAPTISTISSFQFTREEADQYIGETCVVYLSFNDFETQITRYTNRTKAHMAVIEKALLQSESIASGGLVESAVVALSKLLRPSSTYKPSNIDYSRHVPQATYGLQSKYELLGYVVKEWLSHTSKLYSESTGAAGFNAQATDIWRRFQKLVFQKQLLFNLRPWDEVAVKNPNLPYMHLVCWAPRNDHLALLRSLKESTPLSVEHYFRAAAEWFGSKNPSYLNATLSSHDSQNDRIVDMSSILLPDLQQMTESPDPCALFHSVYEACSRGASEIIELYVSGLSFLDFHEADQIQVVAQLNCEYLMIEAAAHGQESVCKGLLPYCKFQAYTIDQGRPCGALKRAAYQGHTAVVSMLQACPAALVSAMEIRPNEKRIPGQWKDFEAKLFIDAARSGDLNVVTTLFSVCNSEMLAADHEHETELLLSDLSSIVIGERAMMQAIDGGYKDVVIHLLDQGVSINNPLPWRIFDTDQDLSRRSSLDFARMVEMGCFALHIAIANNDAAITKLLLEADADPDLCVYYFQNHTHVNRKWKSPLAHAATLGNIEIARDLVDYGANIESQYLSTTSLESMRFRYTTPLIIAASSGKVDVLTYLLEIGAGIDNFDFAGFTPLAAAARGDQLECAKMLIDNGASLDFLEHDKIALASPTIEAIRNGNKAMLTLLLEAGISLNATSQRKMPLTVAIEEGDEEIVDILIAFGADVDGDEEARISIGWPASPLCRAIKTDQIRITKLLLKGGADLNALVGSNGTSPLLMAQERYSGDQLGELMALSSQARQVDVGNVRIEENVPPDVQERTSPEPQLDTQPSSQPVTEMEGSAQIQVPLEEENEMDIQPVAEERQDEAELTATFESSDDDVSEGEGEGEDSTAENQYLQESVFFRAPLDPAAYERMERSYEEDTNPTELLVRVSEAIASMHYQSLRAKACQDNLPSAHGADAFLPRSA